MNYSKMNMSAASNQGEPILEDEIRELSEEEILFMQVTGGAKGIGGGPIFGGGGS